MAAFFFLVWGLWFRSFHVLQNGGVPVFVVVLGEQQIPLRGMTERKATATTLAARWYALVEIFWGLSER